MYFTAHLHSLYSRPDDARFSRPLDASILAMPGAVPTYIIFNFLGMQTQPLLDIDNNNGKEKLFDSGEDPFLNAEIIADAITTGQEFDKGKKRHS